MRPPGALLIPATSLLLVGYTDFVFGTRLLSFFFVIVVMDKKPAVTDAEDASAPVAAAAADSAPVAAASAQVAAAAAASALVTLGLPRFSGDGGIDRFLDDFDRHARLQNWTDCRKVDILPLCLTGIARDAFDALSREQRGTFQTAADGLRDAFSKRSAVDYHLALRGLRYDPRESLDHFVITLRKHVAKAFPSQPQDGLGELLFNHFLSALPDDFYAAVVADGIISFDAAVAMVRNKRNAARGNHDAPVRSLAADGGGEAVIAQLQRRIAELESQLQERSFRPRSGAPRRPRECFACGELGHMRWQCVKRDHRCQRCGSLGHVEAVCGKYPPAENWQGTVPGSGVESRPTQGRQTE